MSRISVWREVLWQTASKWSEHDSMAQSAALAFYTLFSLAPLLIVVIAVAGIVFGEEAVRGQIVRQFAGLMGADAASAVQRILQKVATARAAGLAGVLGAVTLLSGATGAFVQLQACLNRVWDVAPKPGHVLRTLLKKRLTSFALIIGIGFLLLVSLALSAAVSGFAEYIRSRYAVPPALLEAGNVLLSFAVFTLLFAMIYRILPDAEIAWRDVWVGAIATSVLFAIGKTLIGLYLGRTAIASPYGAAGSVVVILLWVHYASAILLLGAEFTRAYSRRVFGTRSQASPGAERAGPIPDVPAR